MQFISKADARAFGKGARALMTADERHDASEQVARRCQESVDLGSMHRVHIFISISRNFEVDTRPLLDRLLAIHGVEVFAPRMEGSRMACGRVTAETQYELGAYSVLEPPAASVVATAAMDLIFVPLLAFDMLGHRAGYGGGHYDRFLAGQLQATKVGLAFEACRLKGAAILPGAHDVRLDMAVTEAGVYVFN